MSPYPRFAGLGIDGARIVAMVEEQLYFQRKEESADSDWEDDGDWEEIDSQ